MVVTPQDLIDCYHERFTYVWECADFLGITKQALERALSAYSNSFLKVLYTAIINCF